MDRKEQIDLCLDELMQDEGFEPKPYRCPTGHLTIGFGRNLEDRGITRAEAKMLLLNDIMLATTFLEQYLTNWGEVNSVRQCALINMVVNMGAGGFKEFKKMIKYISFAEWDKVADEAKDSLWYKQVGKRAERIVNQLREG